MSGPAEGDAGVPPGVRRLRIERRGGGAEDDWLAVEEPLEMRVDGEPLVVTMRTPGNDLELAAGFLFGEGVVRRADDLRSLESCTDPLAYDPDNVVEVGLASAARRRRQSLERARRDLVAVSACGLCGKARLEAVFQRLPNTPPPPLDVDADLLCDLPTRMARRQQLFELTGGLHAAALFDPSGELIALREDVGRHNAVDKLVGRALLRGELPWHGRILVVSARAGFEIVQKAMMAAVPVMAAVGAASSLAVDAARRGGLELYSFVRPGRANRHL